MTADEAVERLREGNQRFVAGTAEHPHQDEQRRVEQAGGQTPFATVLGCADSRVAPELLFDQGIGDLFTVRVAGNTAADQLTLGSIEFGVSVLECPLLLVLGHEACGAVKATLDAVVAGKGLPGHLAALAHPIVPAVQAVRSRQHGDIVDAAVKENVQRQVGVLANAFRNVRVVGAQYGLHTGEVDFFT